MQTTSRVFLWVQVAHNGLSESSGVVCAEDYTEAMWCVCNRFGYDMLSPFIWMIDITDDLRSGCNISCDEFRQSEIKYWRSSNDFRRTAASVSN